MYHSSYWGFAWLGCGPALPTASWVTHLLDTLPMPSTRVASLDTPWTVLLRASPGHQLGEAPHRVRHVAKAWEAHEPDDHRVRSKEIPPDGRLEAGQLAFPKRGAEIIGGSWKADWFPAGQRCRAMSTFFSPGSRFSPFLPNERSAVWFSVCDQHGHRPRAMPQCAH